jgi:hypothetical protein
LPELAVAALQLATGVGPVRAVLHVIVVYELPGAAVCGVQDAAGVGPVVAAVQVVAVQLFDVLAGSLVQLTTGVGPVVTVSHVMFPPGTQLPTGPGVHSSVLASQERSWEVLRYAMLVEI